MQDDEEWVDLEDYWPYQVHPDGYIRNRRTDRVLKTAVVDDKYQIVTLRSGGTNHVVYVHVVVCETFNPRPSSQHKLIYKNGDYLDCSVDNLEWAT